MPFVPLSQRGGRELPADAFDLRGWVVRTEADRRRVGTVSDLLLDAGGGPRYIEIALDRTGREVLLPIGQARSDREQRVIWVPGVTGESLESLPEYGRDPDALTRDYETRLVAACRRALTGETRSSPRRVHGGAVYGSSEVEDGLVVEPAPALVPLSKLPDYRVAEGDADPRGWPVLAGDGAAIGAVDELLVERAVAKVRYLVCSVEEERLGLERLDRRVLLPAGFVRLDPPNERVLVDVLTAASVSDLPRYAGEPVGPEVEQELLERVEAGSGERFYQHPRFDYRACYGPTPP